MTALYMKTFNTRHFKGSPCQQVLSSGPTEDWLYFIWVEKQTNKNYTYTLCKKHVLYFLDPTRSSCHEGVWVSDYDVEDTMTLLWNILTPCN